MPWTEQVDTLPLMVWEGLQESLPHHRHLGPYLDLLINGLFMWQYGTVLPCIILCSRVGVSLAILVLITPHELQGQLALREKTAAGDLDGHHIHSLTCRTPIQESITSSPTCSHLPLSCRRWFPSTRSYLFLQILTSFLVARLGAPPSYLPGYNRYECYCALYRFYYRQPRF